MAKVNDLNYMTQELADKIIEEVFQVYKMTLAFYNSLSCD